MTAPDAPAPAAGLLQGYEVMRVASLYRRNDGESADREYRVALLRREGSNGCNVFVEYGRRGTRLKPSLLFPRDVAERDARSAYVERGREKLDKGYREVELKALEPLYRQLAELGMERFDVDLFVDLRGKVVSVPQYLSNNGMAASELSARASAYAAKCAVAGVFGQLDATLGQGVDPEQDVNYQLGVRLLEVDLARTDLPLVGVFMGRRTAHGVRPCSGELPAAAPQASPSGPRRQPM